MTSSSSEEAKHHQEHCRLPIADCRFFFASTHYQF
jgi:hypothetical protein